jgi:hypothetical protein
MAKFEDYEELGRHLAAQDKSEISMTFSDVEKIIGRTLPKSAKYPAWWSNNPSNNPMTLVWRKAGFKTEQVDVANRRLVFRRVRQPRAPLAQTALLGAPQLPDFFERLRASGKSTPTAGREEISGTGSTECRHPAFGALKGLIHIAPGVDLTEPADPEWGDRAWGDDTK